ncbi:bifunctional lysylphosphatidylglycerol flippase/synthetase MprF [Pelagicoccus sp. SDUM812002]|uniref:bifunctional lysylphosphatidylglycerol flippase/synthetase MprF n=1 Tax=Pelagicoccus sp. SDUM812002 TaxID=3041266 RepID=UPI0028101C1E|nr:bifunctional lysylphosphatidylglycerol flippase/synthetase MprF [Pelagicoccus sp. SDUM812002]MDQ8187560.1 bifunctional lysylphosphatidylglycerol flippase/synthetase MprF [Pelagicoccus sp. SDUM812002]
MSETVAKAWKKRVVTLGVFLLAAGLMYLLFQNLSKFDYRSILETVKSYSAGAIGLAIFFTAVSYVLMGGYDWLGQAYIGKRQNWKRTLLVAFYSYVLSLNVGLSIVSSSAVRYKMYQGWGYKAKDIAKLIVFASVSFWLGLIVLAGAALCASNVSFDGTYPISDALVKPMGALMVLSGVAYVIACRFSTNGIKFKGRTLSLPSWKSGVGQISITVADTVAAATALYFLIPDDNLSFFAFTSIFCIAFFGGLVSSTPGGIGVFETVFLLFLPTTADSNELMAALLVYRAIYFLLPLLVACSLFAALEGKAVAGRAGPGVKKAQGWLSVIAPRVLSAFIFVGGLMLLFAGSLPPNSMHMSWLEEILPLALIELSHFAVSLIGLALLFLAYGIKRKIDSSYYLTLLVLCIGAPLSLLRGDGFGAFAVLAVMATVLAPCRRYFYRKSSLLELNMESGSILAVLLAVASSIYLGFFVYHHGAYETQSWWQFEFDAEKPRFLRTSFAIALLSLLFALYKLVHTARPDAGESFWKKREAVERVLANSPVASANLALMGDKRFFFNDDETAFIMFSISGKTWVSMGDPVGEARAFKDLINAFQETAARFGGQPVFYQASKDHLFNYVDVGLRPVKVGEIARVRIADFSLEGSKRQSMRSRLKRASKKGCTFEILSQKDALLEMETLRQISDEWLVSKKAKEKGFSLGYFDESYLANFRIAVVRVEGAIVAFTNIWEARKPQELSIDLMRYANAAPPSIMEFLFVELLLWAKQEAFTFFDLRVAPLSGITVGNTAPLAHKVLDLVFNHGENFYGFRGLRAYKDRFNPEWEPIYVATPSSWRMPFVTADLTRVVSSPPSKRPAALAQYSEN